MKSSQVLFSVVVVLLALGCSSSDDPVASNPAGSGGSGGAGSGHGGSGGATSSGGDGGSSQVIIDGGVSDGANTGDADPLTGCGSNLTGIIRDFHSSHPDFECTKHYSNIDFDDPSNKDCGPWDPSIVGKLGSAISADRKPVYAGGSKTPSSTGAANFDQWYRDVDGVNKAGDLRLDLTKTATGTYAYETDRFFPIDGKLFAAESNDPDKGRFFDDDQKARNFHFTYELHTSFRYDKGNVFTFQGDDDVFVYINDKLVTNIGGIHVPIRSTINLDTGRVEVTAPTGSPDLSVMADLGFTESMQGGGVAGHVDLGLQEGKEYKLDFFFAERNSGGSNFRIESNLVFVKCGAGVTR